MAKTIWKGTISFGLVNINIELYTAVKEHTFGFKLLHAKCHTPIVYKRFCPTCNQEVQWSDIVKGLKLDNGKYFIITKENLEKLRPEKTDRIDIIEFIQKDSLEPIYYEHHYYALPGKLTDKAYFLFEMALQKTGKIAIGQFVMRDKEYICALAPYHDILLLSTLNYEYEIQPIKDIEKIKIPKLETAEFKLADQLINKLTHKKLDMSKFKDRFAEQLKKKIEQASKGIAIPKGKKVKKVEEKGRKEASLITALKASLKTPKSRTSTQPVARAKSRR